MSRHLMLVSARADARLRDDVRRGRRPCPDYLRLEERHGVELLDWSQLGPSASGRSPRLSLAHTRAALRRLDALDAVFSDGEHLGVPLALTMRLRGQWLHRSHLDPWGSDDQEDDQPGRGQLTDRKAGLLPP